MESAETFPTLHQSSRYQGNLSGWKNYVPHGIQSIMFHGLPNFASRPPQRCGSNMKPRHNGASKSHNPRFRITYCVEGPTWIGWWWITICWEPSRICLHTTLEGMWPHNFQVQYSMVCHSNNVQGPSQCHGHILKWPSVALLRPWVLQEQRRKWKNTCWHSWVSKAATSNVFCIPEAYLHTWWVSMSHHSHI